MYFSAEFVTFQSKIFELSAIIWILEIKQIKILINGEHISFI